MTATATTRGRKEIFAKPELLANVLSEIKLGVAEGARPVATRFLVERLAEAKLVRFATVKGEGRGRPRKVAALTGAGNKTLNRLAAQIVRDA